LGQVSDVSETLRGWLRSLAAAVPEDDVPVTVFDEMDELHAQRVERRNPTWFPRGGGHELARLARRRRRERAIPSG
jgi:hypothetical protein